MGIAQSRVASRGAKLANIGPTCRPQFTRTAVHEAVHLLHLRTRALTIT